MLGRIASECKCARAVVMKLCLILLLFPCLLAHIAVKVKTPGPGTYNDATAMASDGRYLNSVHRNSCVPTFKTPRTSCERVISAKALKDIPGPG